MLRCVLILSLLVAARSSAQTQAAVVPGPPPKIVLTNGIDERDAIVIVDIVQVPVEKSVPVQTKIDGKIITEERKVITLESQTVTRSTPLQLFRAQELDGTEIPLAELRKRLGKNAPVVMTSTAEKLDIVYRSLFAKGTVVLVPRNAVFNPKLPRPFPMPAEPKAPQ